MELFENEHTTVKLWRNYIGATDPNDAYYGTLRRIYGKSRRENAVHGSDSVESAKRELSIFWRDED